MICAFGLRNLYPVNGILPALIRSYQGKVRSYYMGDEAVILTGLRDLEPQAITNIHEAFFPTVFRYVCYRVGDDVVAEDLASEAFIRLLEALHAGKGPKTSVRGWLMGTVSNLVNDYFRQVYNQPKELPPETLFVQNSDPESLSEKHSRQEIIRKGLSKLTPDQQDVLALRFGSGCTLVETAEIMGKKPNAIKQLQFRALAAMRRHIEAEI